MLKFIPILAALLTMTVAVPAFAEMTAAQRDECLLVSRNCIGAVDDIQSKIQKITREIDKGASVYSPEELKKLEMKLADVRALLREMDKQ